MSEETRATYMWDLPRCPARSTPLRWMRAAISPMGFSRAPVLRVMCAISMALMHTRTAGERTRKWLRSGTGSTT